MWESHRIVYFKYLFWIITIGILGLRLGLLNAYQLTYDECSALERSVFNTWHSFWNNAVKPDAHPFLLQAYTVFIVNLFGYSAAALKLPILLLSILNVFLAFKLGERIYTGSGYILSAFFTASFIIVYYAPIARMYTPGLSFTLILILTSLNCIKQEPIHWKTGLLWIFSAWALVSTHHMGILLLITLIPMLAFKISKSNRKPFGLMLAITLLLYAPQLPVTWVQLHHAGIGPAQGGWLDPPHWSMIIKWIQVFLGTGYAAWFLGALALWMFWKSRHHISMFIVLLGFVLAVINVLVIYLYSIWLAPIMQFSVLVFSGIGFLMIWAACTKGFSENSLVIMGLLVLGILAIQTFYVKAIYPQHLKSAYEEPYSILKQNHTKGVSALFCNSEPFIHTLFISKYNLKNQHFFPVAQNADMRAKEIWLAQQKTRYIIVASPFPVELERIKQYYPYVVTHHETAAVNWYLMSRQAQHSKHNIYNTVFTENWPQFTSGTITSNQMQQQNTFNAEFPLAIQYNYNTRSLKEGDVLFAKAITDTTSDTFLELCIAVKAKSNTIAYASANGINGKILTQLYIGPWIQTYKGDTLTASVYFWNKNFKTHALKQLRISQIQYWPQHWTMWD